MSRATGGLGNTRSNEGLKAPFWPVLFLDRKEGPVFWSACPMCGVRVRGTRWISQINEIPRSFAVLLYYGEQRTRVSGEVECGGICVWRG